MTKLEGSIEKKDGVLVITIDGRIWKRKQIHRGRPDNAGYEDYLDAVYRFFAENRIFDYPRYREKVWISFIQHYDKRERMLDVDNMEIKPFVDAVCMYLLPDDSPEQCAVTLDGLPDQKEFLEIRIFPYASCRNDARQGTNQCVEAAFF